MKFVHIADMHLDCPFRSLNQIEGLSNIRRLEQRQILKEIIEYIKENQIPYFIIAGDLYEHEYVKYSTISYLNNLFQMIPNTKILIVPGNHDPYLKNSYYSTFKWSSNVFIFHQDQTIIEEQEVTFYGYGFHDFYCKNSEIEKMKIENRDKINILITHGSLDGASDEDRQYNPISSKVLKNIGFDYVALGHIHKNNYGTSERIIYPGSPISLGFDELGKHGMIVGEITKESLKTAFIPLDKREFVEKEMKIDSILSEEELIEKINEVEIEECELCKLILSGKRNFEINISSLYPLITNKHILKIKDQTKQRYNLEELAKEKSLKGFFVKNMLEKMQQENIEKEIIEKSIEIGLDALEKG